MCTAPSRNVPQTRNCKPVAPRDLVITDPFTINDPFSQLYGKVKYNQPLLWQSLKYSTRLSTFHRHGPKHHDVIHLKLKALI